MVFDTSVLVAAIRSDKGASRQLLLGAMAAKFTVLASVPLMIEYEAVMTRPEHLVAAGVSAAEIGVLLDAVAAIAEPVKLAFLWRPALRDPDDDMVLEAAVNGNADMIVTFNLRDFARVATRFGIAILQPSDAMRALRTRS